MRVAILILIIFLFLAPLISANIFSDFLNKFTGTGKATQQVDLNITVGAIKITHVFTESMTDVSTGLNSGPSSTSVTIDFTAYHGAGSQNIDNASATMNFTKAGETTRINSSCRNITGLASNYMNFSCTITMWWWDGAGTWNAVAQVKDLNNNGVINSTASFSIGSTTGFERGPANLSWTTIGAGSTNSTSSNDPILLNNTGNAGIGVGSGNITINSTNLLGESDDSYGLWTGNFSISNDTGGSCSGDSCTECAGTQMNKSSGNYVSVGNAILPAGNYTLNDGNTGQEQLYVCLRLAGSELITQSYSTKKQGAWTIQI
jgi:hypothetical protein